jgi:hypothetical protein
MRTSLTLGFCSLGLTERKRKKERILLTRLKNVMTEKKKKKKTH